MKRYLILLHRYLGLAAAAFLLLIGLSGSLLLFRPELESLSGARPAPAHRPIHYQALADAVAARYPGAVFNLRLAEDGPIQARVRQPGDERRLWLTADGRVESDRPRGDSAFEWLLELHEKLLLGETGAALAGMCGLLLTALAISGLVYWWPRDWRRAWQVRRGKGQKIWVTDLHRLSGALASLLLLSAGLTGAYQAFDKPLNRGINQLYGYRAPGKAKLDTPPGLPRLPLDALVARAAQSMPDGRLVDIRYDPSPQRPLLLRWRLAGELHPNGRSLVEIDPYSGRLLRVTPVEQAAPAIRLSSWVYALHTGSLGGNILRMLLAAAGLSLAWLSASGAWQWAARRRKQRASQAARAAA
ncbi:PepSY-associated TM helix domain-containing protein [Chromobacterium paludis]|uniref:PepSY domain-containing protein n=1 Tax=Chromobacterium paludis TaxID=2605945 RepID=A0A5C1DHQ2_9NEIS|nr:PepSY-associated TM helix domain-containing protein [Chromobacterium paludis]QEL55168.1 PepSY domain-containing protein [Chromobacterium paludis]